jgi:hypothetical protein
MVQQGISHKVEPYIKYNYYVSGQHILSCFYLKHNVSGTGFCLFSGATY